MSTGAECCFKEKEKGKWFYALQNYPYGETESFTEHGAFRTFKEALAHLDSNHANPGGWSTIRTTKCDHKGHEVLEDAGKVWERKWCAYCGIDLE